MARRFIIDKNLEKGMTFDVEGEEARHIFVLRHGVGDKIQVNDKLCEILEVSKQKMSCKVIDDAEVRGIPSLKITLFQAFLKADKMDFVVQKAVELGVSKIIPFISKNVVVKIEEKDKIKKIERLNRISKEASKQCGRSDVVEVSDILEFKDAVKEIREYNNAFIAYENETNALKSFLKENKEINEVAIIIGAEGGFDKEEVRDFTDAGCFSISLGERILRAETASLNLISILMYELD